MMRKVAGDIPGEIWEYPQKFWGLTLGVLHKMWGLLGDLLSKATRCGDFAFFRIFFARNFSISCSP
jgi:hypothetical protein